MGQNYLNYYKGMYDHFILNRIENDFNSVKSEDSEEAASEPKFAHIKPRKTKFIPHSFYNCSFCGKWYRSKTSLGLHRRLECGKEPAFQCPYCPLKTHQKGNLQVHIKKKHSESSSGSQSMKSRNPILAQELGMSSNVNAHQLGINLEVSSELTITRSQPGLTNSTRTPHLTHILSQPNKARGVTQFPLTVSEINAASQTQNDSNKIRVRGLARIPPGIEITENTKMRDERKSMTNTAETKSPPNQLKTNNKPKIQCLNSAEGTSKQADIKKLPELTRILNSQESIPPVPLIVDVFSTTGSFSDAIEECVPSPAAEEEPLDPPDSTAEEAS